MRYSPQELDRLTNEKLDLDPLMMIGGGLTSSSTFCYPTSKEERNDRQMSPHSHPSKRLNLEVIEGS